jgi:hypothetical protein
MTRYLEVFGTSFTVPDPNSVASLSASFRTVCVNIGDAQNQLSALGSPQAWGEWTGQAADAFSRSIGALPHQLDQAWQSYNTVASALADYAGELSPVVAALGNLAFQAEEAEGTLRATTTARDQVIQQGQDPRTTGWDARLWDAQAAVDAIENRLSSLLRQMGELSAQCVALIRQAEHEGIQNNLITDFQRYVVQDTAEPLISADVKAVDFTAVVLYDALIKPFIDLPGEVRKLPGDVRELAEHPTFHNLGVVLDDVSSVFSVLALVALIVIAIVPGTDVVGLPALAAYLGDATEAADAAATVANSAAAASHEQGATWGEAGNSALDFGLDAVSPLVDDGTPKGSLATGVGAGVVGSALSLAGSQHAFSCPDLMPGEPDVLSEALGLTGALPVVPGIPLAVPGPEPALLPGGGISILRMFGGGLTYSPAVATFQHVKFDLESVGNVGRIRSDLTASQGMGT